MVGIRVTLGTRLIVVSQWYEDPVGSASRSQEQMLEMGIPASSRGRVPCCGRPAELGYAKG